METTPVKARSNQADIVGVDLGVKNLITKSNGEIVEGRKPLKKLSRRLARMQRHLAKCTKGSKRSNRKKMLWARLHYRICCIRKDVSQKSTHHLCQGFKVVCLEDFPGKGMLKNHKLAKAISDLWFYEFKRQLEYLPFLEIGFRRFLLGFPSSKTCSNCGHRRNEAFRTSKSL